MSAGPQAAVYAHKNYIYVGIYTLSLCLCIDFMHSVTPSPCLRGLLSTNLNSGILWKAMIQMLVVVGLRPNHVSVLLLSQL